jgi:type IX secretion system PorP/SprF family membrane protein
MFFPAKLLISAVLTLGCVHLSAQNYPVYNSFYVNPYLYNPAEAATDFTYVYLTHRLQWTGIDGAPVLSSLSFTTLLNETRAGVGGKISSYKRSVLTTTDITLSYAYGIPVSKANWLFFGLSGGVISNTIDLANVSDPTDPALKNYMANNLQPVANFGMLLRTASGLNFGVALPQLFTPKFNSESAFSSTAVSPFDNILVSAYYRKRVEGKLVSRTKGGVRSRKKTGEGNAPLEFYLNYKYSSFGNSQLEALAKLNLSKNFWIGGSYRLSYGFTANLGFTYERITLAYSYEPGGQPDPGFSSGTHDAILGVRLGERKKFKRSTPELHSQLKNVPAEHHAARFQAEVEDPDKINKDETAQKKYYVVIRAFADFNQADVYKKKLIAEKYNANVFYHEKEKKYYVYLLETSKQHEANEEARNLRNYTKLKSASVLTVTVSPKE